MYDEIKLPIYNINDYIMSVQMDLAKFNADMKNNSQGGKAVTKTEWMEVLIAWLKMNTKDT